MKSTYSVSSKRAMAANDLKEERKDTSECGQNEREQRKRVQGYIIFLTVQERAHIYGFRSSGIKKMGVRTG